MNQIRWLAVVCAVSFVAGPRAEAFQTWAPTTGMVLPSGRYLQHLPQYIPPTPVYPLPRESTPIERAKPAAAPVAPVPQPVVPGPVRR
jgi:hypothetical protein